MTAQTTENSTSRIPREWVIGGIVAVALIGVWLAQGLPFALRMFVEASCYAILAMGFTIQWGYAGQLNAGVLGFLALGGFSAMFFSMPRNPDFWHSGLPLDVLGALIRLIVGVAIVVALSRLNRLGVPPRLRTVITFAAAMVVYFWIKYHFTPIAGAIEDQAGYVGGLGMYPLVGWVMGGLLAGFVGYFIGRICLGLRSDYLVIATLGIAEIIKAIMVNEGWLTRGVMTVSPIPWPVPGAGEIGFLAARASFMVISVLVLAGIFLLLQRAYHSPWGRMTRAIRDNEVSAAAMGKNINYRRLEIFVFGCILMGIGGAALTNFTGIFNPQGYLPLNHTFLILVMVILGGPGNNLGTVLGAFLVYVIWVMSGPLALMVMEAVVGIGEAWFAWEAPDNISSRALQARVFVIGLLISVILRFAPRGLMPEKVPKHES